MRSLQWYKRGAAYGYDIDEGAKLFMSKVSCGELPLEQAKNLLIAFSRLKTVK